MKRYWNNKGRIILYSEFLALCSKLYAKHPMLLALSSMLLALCYLLYPERANSGPYLNSAHSGYGVTSGVNRSGLSSFGYAVGNCVHCHEQHTSIGGSEPTPTGGPDKYELFRGLFTSQASMFCYSCHGTVDTPMQTLPTNQYNYSYMAGGDTTATCPANIREAFQFVNATTGASQLNCGSSYGSSHFLANIQIFLTNKWNFGSTTADINPCSGCHNPHRAQRDPHTSGNRGWPVSLPSQHSTDNNAWGLWGDNLPTATERMSNYVGALRYQAPYRYGSTTTYEPDGSTTQDGSNLTDYATFCTDCHNTTYTTISSTPLGRNLKTIDWNTEKHGRGVASNDTFTDVNSPYQDTQCGNYVLACTDCHEPHGARNPFLARQRVNNGTFSYPGGRGNWRDFCSRCHNQMGHAPAGPHDTNWGCVNCHNGGTYKPCTTCHYHGGSFGGNVTF